MSIEIYSDFLCPWCYIGHRKLGKAVAALPQQIRPQPRWRSYQLSPNESRHPGITAAEAMRGWYPNEVEAVARIARIKEAGRLEGLQLNLDLARPVNTFDAHRLSHMAMSVGLTEPVHELLFHAYHTVGENIADGNVLVEIARSAGLNVDDVCVMLGTDRFGDAVRADQIRAKQNHVNGVPTMIIDGGEPHSLIQEQGVLLSLIKEAVVKHGVDRGLGRGVSSAQ